MTDPPAGKETQTPRCRATHPIPVLLGDVGGTKTLLAKAQLEGNQVLINQSSLQRLPSTSFSRFPELVKTFLNKRGEPSPRWACFGVPGPVVQGFCRTTNLPWELEELSLAAELGLERVMLINDLAASAWAFSAMPPPKTHQLREGQVISTHPLLVVAAGTGLGAALLVPTANSFTVLATEAGHCNLGCLARQDMEIFSEVEKEFGFVSYELVVSGKGLVRIYRYLLGTPLPEAVEKAPDPPARVLAAFARDPKAHMAALFVARYLGAFVGNLALTTLPLAGVVLAGSVAAALVGDEAPPGAREAFFASLNRKGPHEKLLASLPVALALEPETPLFGCGQALLTAKG